MTDYDEAVWLLLTAKELLLSSDDQRSQYLGHRLARLLVASIEVPKINEARARGRAACSLRPTRPAR